METKQNCNIVALPNPLPIENNAKKLVPINWKEDLLLDQDTNF